MSTGQYGVINLANSVPASSIDVFYYYVPDRNTPPTQYLPLYPSGPSASDFLSLNGSTGYSLRLPASTFNQIGFYVINIVPKAYSLVITSCGVVVSTTTTPATSSIQVSKQGIVIPAASLGSSASSSSSGGLTGYRIQYFDNNGNLLPYSRIVTSSDLVSPSNSTSLSSNNASFVLDPNGSYLFLTLSPDQQSLLFSSQQSLGQAGQNIILSNSALFDPVTLEVELTDQSVETLAIGLFGNSTRDLGNGQYTVYDNQGNLYAQYLLAQTKNTVTNSIVEFKQQIANPTPNQNFLSTTQGL